MASVPEAAESTSILLLLRARSTTVLTLTLSSTTRTLAMLSPFFWIGHCQRRAGFCPRSAFVDAGGDAEKKLIDAARDGLGQGREVGALHLVEPERGPRLALRDLNERGKRGFARPRTEGCVDEPPHFEQHRALTHRKLDDERACLPPEGDRLGDRSQIHHIERSL